MDKFPSPHLARVSERHRGQVSAHRPEERHQSRVTKRSPPFQKLTFGWCSRNVGHKLHPEASRVQKPKRFAKQISAGVLFFGGVPWIFHSLYVRRCTKRTTRHDVQRSAHLMRHALRPLYQNATFDARTVPTRGASCVNQPKSSKHVFFERSVWRRGRWRRLDASSFG